MNLELINSTLLYKEDTNMTIQSLKQVATIINLMVQRSEEEAKGYMGDEYNPEEAEFSLGMLDWLAEINELAVDYDWSNGVKLAAAKALYEMQK